MPLTLLIHSCRRSQLLDPGHTIEIRLLPLWKWNSICRFHIIDYFVLSFLLDVFFCHNCSGLLVTRHIFLVVNVSHASFFRRRASSFLQLFNPFNFNLELSLSLGVCLPLNFKLLSNSNDLFPDLLNLIVFSFRTILPLLSVLSLPLELRLDVFLVLLQPTHFLLQLFYLHR